MSESRWIKDGQYNIKDTKTGEHKFYSPFNPTSQGTVNENKNDPVKVYPIEGSTTGPYRYGKK